MRLNSDTPGFEPGIFRHFISPRCTISYVSFLCLSVQALLKRTLSSGVWALEVHYVIIVVFLLASLASSHQTSFADLRLFPRIQHSFILVSRRRRWSRRRNVVAAACYLWVFFAVAFYGTRMLMMDFVWKATPVMWVFHLLTEEKGGLLSAIL